MASDTPGVIETGQSPNRLLAGLTPHTFELVLRESSRVQLVYGQVIAGPAETLDRVHFMLHGLVSMVDVTTPPLGVQLAMVGRNGAVGLVEAVLGSPAAFAQAVVQIGGTALRVSVDRLQSLLKSCDDLRTIGLQSANDYIAELIDGAVANSTHSVLERCVRWLVLASDRLESNEVLITQDGLSTLLGSQRSGVTTAIATLQRQHFIQTGRGRITILDPIGLRTLISNRRVLGQSPG